MSLYIAGVEVGVNNNIVVNGDDNILVYKFQDLTNKLYKNKFAEIASDAEYEAAEIQLQQIYKEVMEGNNE